MELLPMTADESVTILCYESMYRIWAKKTLHFSMPRYPWSSANVFSHDNKLWWVDLPLVEKRPPVPVCKAH
jgi:hypothetical protein